MKKNKIQARVGAILLLLAASLPLLMTACSPTDNPASPFAHFIDPIGTPTCTQFEGWVGNDQMDGYRDFTPGTMGFTKGTLDHWARVTEFAAQICAGLGPALTVGTSAVEPGAVRVVVGLYTDLNGKPYQLIAKSDPIDFGGYCEEGFNFYYYGGEKSGEIYLKPGTYWIALGNQEGQAQVAQFSEGGGSSWTSDCFFPNVLTSNCLRSASPLKMRAYWVCYGGGQG